MKIDYEWKREELENERENERASERVRERERIICCFDLQSLTKLIKLNWFLVYLNEVTTATLLSHAPIYNNKYIQSKWRKKAQANNKQTKRTTQQASPLPSQPYKSQLACKQASKPEFKIFFYFYYFYYYYSSCYYQV